MEEEQRIIESAILPHVNSDEEDSQDEAPVVMEGAAAPSRVFEGRDLRAGDDDVISLSSNSASPNKKARHALDCSQDQFENDEASLFGDFEGA